MGKTGFGYLSGVLYVTRLEYTEKNILLSQEHLPIRGCACGGYSPSYEPGQLPQKSELTTNGLGQRAACTRASGQLPHHGRTRRHDGDRRTHATPYLLITLVTH